MKIVDSALAKYINARAESDNKPPMPTWYPEDDPERRPEEEFHPDLFQMTRPSVVFEEVETKAVRPGTSKPVRKK